jgi:hypothetical protein
MQELDLTPFGFEGKTFRYHGRILSERNDGQRLLFLFDEAHKNQPAIRLAILNACELWRLEVLGCVGVEEYPFYFLGWDDAANSRTLGRRFRPVHR